MVSEDEIGTCSNIEVNLQVLDDSPFLIRPFHVKEEGKPVIDNEMQMLVYFGILKQEMSPYSSHIMLTTRKNSILKRIIIDFKFLNSRLHRGNLAFPLIGDAFAILGSSKCDYLSVIHLKDAYHTIQLSESSQPYYGILLYFGSASNVYQRMHRGVSANPGISQS